ncbi:hypothetical protein FHG87_019903 [Trinorchestia longiramus]|nr:hypothetical protein FHG87_019903 [Trinorchestia longiramus]
MGLGVMQTKNEMSLEQSAYTKALLSRFGMEKANSVATPVDINADPVTTSDEVEECDKDLYQSAVGFSFRSQFRSQFSIRSSFGFTNFKFPVLVFDLGPNFCSNFDRVHE